MVKITILGIITEKEFKIVGARKLSLLEGKIRAENKGVIEFAFRCWGSQAEAINDNVNIGDQVLIDGKLSLDLFSNKAEQFIDVNDLVKCSYGLVKK